MSRILIADDEKNIRSALENLLSAEGHEVIQAERGDELLTTTQEELPDLIITDVRMPGMTGLEALTRLRVSFPRIPVIVMTGHADMQVAVEAAQAGAFEYHVKPFEPEAMLCSIREALESARLMSEVVEVLPGAPEPEAIALVGNSPAMQRVYKAIGRVARTDATVLIRGETGTGKELVARAVYRHSLRSDKPFVVLNCTAIPETLLESELFGYEKGAFTGASGRRTGRFEQARGGTIFLDEIGDVPVGVQAKILRVLQERSFERLGGRETIHADVRVVAATNRNLERAIAEGKFREDLLHRLNVFTVNLPALRERIEDVPTLAKYFLGRHARRLHGPAPVLTGPAIKALVRHNWPGNVRELEHCMQRAIIFAGGFPVSPQVIRRALDSNEEPVAAHAGANRSLRDMVRQHLAEHRGEASHGLFIGMVDKLLVSEALQATGGNQTKAAKLLGLTRPTLQAKMQKHSLRKETSVRED